MIGKWIQRVRPSTRRRQTKAHYCDSDLPYGAPPHVVTRCGKEMAYETADGELEEFVARENESRCLTCLRRGA